MSLERERRLTYAFGPLERRGLLGAVGSGQVATLIVGAIVAIVALDRAPSASGAIGAVLAGTAAIAVAFAPLGGRSLPEWTPIATAFLTRRLSGGHRFLSPAPPAGTIAERIGTRVAGVRTTPPRLPPPLRGVRISAKAEHDPPIGVLSERMGRRLTAVLACRVGAFTLLDHEAQERRLARWGLVLSGAGGTAVHRSGSNEPRRPRATSSPAGCTTNATPSSREARRWSSPIWS
jgi:hypothetical protein